MFGLGTSELLIIAAILLVLFGSTRLPRFARSLGEARRELRSLDDPTAD
jgi:sec-independent protein translocase protein TatA